MFYVIDLDERVRADHPLRPIKGIVDAELARMGHLFNKAYGQTGRPGVPPERLLKAMLLQPLYAIRSERQLVERIDTDLLFRWFLDMDPAMDVFDATGFSYKGYEDGAFLEELDGRGVDPHVAIREGPVSPESDGGVLRWLCRKMRGHAGHRTSQRRWKMIEESFGWIKDFAGPRRTRLVGRWKIKQHIQLAAAAYNLVRISRLTPA